MHGLCLGSLDTWLLCSKKMLAWIVRYVCLQRHWWSTSEQGRSRKLGRFETTEGMKWNNEFNLGKSLDLITFTRGLLITLIQISSYRLSIIILNLFVHRHEWKHSTVHKGQRTKGRIAFSRHTSSQNRCTSSNSNALLASAISCYHSATIHLLFTKL